MKQLNRLRPRPAQLILHSGQSLLLAGLDGFIGDGDQGFYYQQTRFLSGMRCRIGGAAPSLVAAAAVDSYSSIAYYLAPTPAGEQAGPEPDSGKESAGEIVKHAIELQINRFLGDGVRHEVILTNHGLLPATVALEWEFAADFADRVEAQGERQQNAEVKRGWRLVDGHGELSFRYCHPQLPHATQILFSGPCEWRPRPGSVAATLRLPCQEPVRLGIEVVPVFLGKPVAFQPSRREFEAAHDPEPGDGLRMTTGSGLVQRAWDRAASDLASLALLDGNGVERRTPAAGVPNYMALFGRDVLMASLQASLAGRETLRGSLSFVAQWQGTKYDDRFDEEPGRVIHQHQRSPLALLEKKPFLHYYGDYSAPGLFLLATAWDFALTGDREFFLSLRDKVLQTLEWMDRDGDRDGDGLYEYATKAGDWGEKNQGWKDSGDAILHENGRMVPDPIAVIEVQGCYYAAKQAIALAFASIGEHSRAQELLAQAERLKRQVNDAFWLPQHNYFALALGPDKKPVTTIAADAGQCLSYGIVDDDKAAAVADRLMAPDLFSGWGVRTLSTGHPAFNPFGYHLGSVWPVANAIIGFGLKRYGFDAHLHRVANGIFEASQLFEYDRLPEVFGGHQRDAAHPHPGIYPNACSPQAWSASAVLSLVQSMLGLLPLAPSETLIVDPDLPEWLPELRLDNIRVGAARIGLRFHRDKSGYTHHEITGQQGRLRVYRPPAGVAGSDNLTRHIRDIAAV